MYPSSYTDSLNYTHDQIKFPHYVSLIRNLFQLKKLVSNIYYYKSNEMKPLVGRLYKFLEAEKIEIQHLSNLLGYDSPSKIYRLFRKEGAMPSAEMIIDISNKFQNLNLNWWLTGDGEMLIKRGNTPQPNNEFSGHNSTDVAIPPHDKPQKISDFVHPTVHPTQKSAQNVTHFTPLDRQVYNLGMPHIISVSDNRTENVIYVPVKARAGYLNGYADPEFMSHLPAYRLPGLDNSTFRMFEVEGPSMAPNIMSGDKVIGEWVDSMAEIRENRVYVVVTRDGVVVKRLLNRLVQRGKIVLKSDTITHRKEYPTYEIDPSDIRELWYCRLNLSSDFSEPSEVFHRISDLEADITGLRADNARYGAAIDQIMKQINPKKAQ